MKAQHLTVIFAIFLSGFLCSCEATAQPLPSLVTFELVADFSTEIPGRAGTFSSFGQKAAIAGNLVVFEANNGLYLADTNGVSRLVDDSVAVPGGSGTFGVVSNETINFDGVNVAFEGFETCCEVSGVYSVAIPSGVVTLVADENTTIPNGEGTFGGFRAPSSDNGEVVFVGFGRPSSIEGIYTTLGASLRVVADQTTPQPRGTGNFLSLGSQFPNIQGSTITFTGNGPGGTRGIYQEKNGTLSVLYDTSTPIPEGTGTFRFLPGDSIDVDTDAFAFLGISTSGQRGVFKDVGHGLELVADMSTAIPDSVGTFRTMANQTISIDNNNVVFKGFGATNDDVGIYAEINGRLVKVIDSTDQLGGLGVHELSLGHDALSGTDIVFRATFEDGTEAIYRATVIPEPSCLSIAVIGLLSMFGKQRKR